MTAEEVGGGGGSQRMWVKTGMGWGRGLGRLYLVYHIYCTVGVYYVLLYTLVWLLFVCEMVVHGAK